MNPLNTRKEAEPKSEGFQNMLIWKRLQITSKQL
jgi:hypothetical protein